MPYIIPNTKENSNCIKSKLNENGVTVHFTCARAKNTAEIMFAHEICCLNIFIPFSTGICNVIIEIGNARNNNSSEGPVKKS